MTKKKQSKIIQLIPADAGWWAKVTSGKGAEYGHARVIAWALKEDGTLCGITCDATGLDEAERQNDARGNHAGYEFKPGRV